MSSAAKWFRSESEWLRSYAARGGAGSEQVGIEAAHHATAADALTALAVPGVADALRNTLNSELFDFSDPVCAALATLAKIARGE